MNAMTGTAKTTDPLTVTIDGRIAHLAFNRPAKRNAINDATLSALDAFFSDIPEGVRAIVLSGEGGPGRIVEEWRRRSSYFTGKRVRVILEGETVHGTTDGLEPNGALRLRKDDGQILIVQAGDVERLRADAFEAGN